MAFFLGVHARTVVIKNHVVTLKVSTFQNRLDRCVTSLSCEARYARVMEEHTAGGRFTSFSSYRSPFISTTTDALDTSGRISVDLLIMNSIPSHLRPNFRRYANHEPDDVATQAECPPINYILSSGSWRQLCVGRRGCTVLVFESHLCSLKQITTSSTFVTFYST
jgi:hypothetical protein